MNSLSISSRSPIPTCNVSDWGGRYWEPSHLPYHNLLWLLSDKSTHVRFCWIPSHCDIEGNKKVDQSAKESLDHNIDPLAKVHYADLKPTHISSSWFRSNGIWPRSLSLEVNTRSTQEISVPDQSWGCHLGSNWSYQTHEVPYLVPGTCRLLATNVERRWPLTCSWNVQLCRKFGMDTTLLTLWRPSLRRFPRLA